MFPKSEHSNISLVYLCLCLVLAFGHLDAKDLTKDEEDQLMDLFMKELTTSVEPEDHNSFLELCIAEREFCSEEQFSGKKALFNWMVSITPRLKERFWRAYKCVFNSESVLCPVDGEWTEWTGWSMCQAECEDGGYQVRTRACENPRPSGGGDNCQGEHQLNRSCVGACIKKSNGREEAQQYIDTIHEAIPGLKNACVKRHCVFEQAQSFIKDTKKLSRYWSTLNCVKYAGACPVNGGWGQWSYWSDCTGQCGWGETVRKRHCDNPVTQNGGVFCQGDWYEFDKCLDTTCNGDEKFSAWSEMSPCSETCGKYGTKSSTMACLTAKPCLLDGRRVSEVTRQQPCFGGHCPNEGSWGKWGPWAACSALCGTGRRTRVRTCDQPYPYGGQPCGGTATDISGCSGDECVQIPSDNEDDDEDDDDDDDDLKRRRSIAFPDSKQEQTSGNIKSESKTTVERRNIASNKMKEYRISISNNDDSSEIKPEGSPRHARATSAAAQTGVTEEAAVIDSNDPYELPLDPTTETLYTSWGPWTSCSVSCGTGTRMRQRFCKDKISVCRGEVKPIQFCNVNPCPVEGGWNSWQAWTPCYVTCGSGTQTRYRTCDNPLPAYGGSCLGFNLHARHCIMPACKPTAEGAWSEWGDWSACSTTCGGGAKTRTRFRKTMSESRSQDAVCNTIPCPEDGLWGAWGGWSKCDRTCGLGNSYRDRTCTDPAPVYGGKPCEGSGSDLQTCFGGPCRDQDDVGVLFQGKGYMLYPSGERASFLMVFIRFKAIKSKGTLFHHTKSCSSKKSRDCDVSIHLKMDRNRLRLTTRLSESTDAVRLAYPDAIRVHQWNDVIVVVTPKWAELKLNRCQRIVKSLPEIELPVNLDGKLRFGMDMENNNGFHGMVSALRKNFKLLHLTAVATNFSALGFPRIVDGVKKISVSTSVRHPDFEGAYYSHLYFRKADHLHIKAVVQTSSNDGLIFFNGGNQSSFLSVVLVEGVVKICLSCENVPKCRSAYELKTGSWILLILTVRGKIITIRMNEGDAMQVMCAEGPNYYPRTSLYVGGAMGADWSIIKEFTKSDARFRGLVDVVYLNGAPVSYKMATLIDDDGVVNSLGYSLADNVKEVKSHEGSIISLVCSEPETLKSDNYVRIIWLKNMELVHIDKHTEIMEVDSNSEYTTTLKMHPGKNHEGIYACVLSVDGELTVVQVFLVLAYASTEQGDEEGRAEWIGFIVIYTLLFLVLFILFVWYCCGDFITSLKERFLKKEEEDEEEQTLLDDTDGEEQTTEARRTLGISPINTGDNDPFTRRSAMLASLLKPRNTLFIDQSDDDGFFPLAGEPTLAEEFNMSPRRTRKRSMIAAESTYQPPASLRNSRPSRMQTSNVYMPQSSAMRTAQRVSFDDDTNPPSMPNSQKTSLANTRQSNAQSLIPSDNSPPPPSAMRKKASEVQRFPDDMEKSDETRMIPNVNPCPPCGITVPMSSFCRENRRVYDERYGVAKYHIKLKPRSADLDRPVNYPQTQTVRQSMRNRPSLPSALIPAGKIPYVNAVQSVDARNEDEATKQLYKVNSNYHNNTADKDE